MGKFLGPSRPDFNLPTSRIEQIAGQLGKLYRFAARARPDGNQPLGYRGCCVGHEACPHRWQWPSASIPYTHLLYSYLPSLGVITF